MPTGGMSETISTKQNIDILVVTEKDNKNLIIYIVTKIQEAFKSCHHFGKYLYPILQGIIVYKEHEFP
jgi:hypothetical protein